MLPTELLMFSIKAGIVQPKVLKPTPTNTALIARLLELFEESVGNKRFELNEELRTLEEGRRDYRVVRGLRAPPGRRSQHLRDRGRAVSAAGAQPRL